MELNNWVQLKIEVTEGIAKLYINNQKQPSLYVKPPKDVTAQNGAIALWVEVGTEGYFTDLKIRKK